MEQFDLDLRSIQEARDLARKGAAAAKQMAGYTSEQIDRILKSMVEAAREHAACLGKMAVEETASAKRWTRPTKTTPPRYCCTRTSRT